MDSLTDQKSQNASPPSLVEPKATPSLIIAEEDEEEEEVPHLKGFRTRGKFILFQWNVSVSSAS